MHGQRLLEDIRWSVIHAQHHGLDHKRTLALTGVSKQQVHQIQDCYNQTGDVWTKHDQWGIKTQGLIYKLTVEHQQVR